MASRPLRALSALALIAAACSDEDTPSADTGSSTDTGADAASDTGTQDTTADSTDEAFGDTTFRLTGVTILRPAGVGGILENLINADIEDELLHVLIQMTDFAGEWPTDFRLTGNAGQAAEGGYTWYDGVEIDHADATIDADGNFSGGPLSIIFPALEPGATEPLQIPVSELSLDGTVFQVDGNDTWFIEGTLSGAILAENITEITVQLSEEADPQPLSQLLGGEGGMDYPVGDDNPRGWRLEAEIEAEDAVFVPAE